MTLILTTEAAHLLRAFRTDTEHGLAPGGRFEFLRDWAGKLPGTVVRIATILHMVSQAHRNSLGNYRIDPNSLGLPFSNFAVAGPVEPAPI